MIATMPAQVDHGLTVACATCRASGLPESDAANVLKAIAAFKSEDRRIRAGENLFRIGEPCDAIYNLVEGWVSLYRFVEGGRRQILHFALPGAVLGWHPAGGATATYNAQTLTDSVVCVLPHKALGPLSREHPEIALRLARLIARNRGLAFDRPHSVGQHSARQRVAQLLLELFVRYRAQWGGYRIQEMLLPLTRDNIVDATGLAPAHVDRALRDLGNEGIVGLYNGQLGILDPDQLVDAAGIDPHVAMSWVDRPLSWLQR